ncbi:hypothetical protein J1N35_004514 [Gossypium stocksii]|uniref:Uncharacterized protein n=1 Tax=Gossypium stocksii TaxID=47602 RepID=A0A9D4AHR2_9ROSI|nr:hypothetical protein J1N35_004514 [Gossypium stocksii]
MTPSSPSAMQSATPMASNFSDGADNRFFSTKKISRKADLSMQDFLMKVKGYCDRLVGCGEVISEQEHVTTILNVVTIITAIQVPYSVQGVTTLLLDAEARQQLTTLETSSSANMLYHSPAVSDSNSVSTPAYRPTSNTSSRGRGHFSVSRV